MRIERVDHVGVTVRSIEKSLAFYQGVLGLELLRRGNDLQSDFIRTLVGLPDARLSNAWLAAPGGGMVELVEYHNPVGEPRYVRPCDPASTHFCLTVDNIGAVYDQLIGNGITFMAEPQRCPGGALEGCTMAYSRDPDGAIIEFIQPPDQ